LLAAVAEENSSRAMERKEVVMAEVLLEWMEIQVVLPMETS
jgi:hypothetical protein